MACAQSSRRCKSCNRHTLHTKATFSNLLGIGLSVITMGLFIPVWLLIGVAEAFRPWRCQACGSGRLT